MSNEPVFSGFTKNPENVARLIEAVRAENGTVTSSFVSGTILKILGLPDDVRYRRATGGIISRLRRRDMLVQTNGEKVRPVLYLAYEEIPCGEAPDTTDLSEDDRLLARAQSIYEKKIEGRVRELEEQKGRLETELNEVKLELMKWRRVKDALVELG